MRKLLLLIGLAVSVGSVYAQDFHFSQIMQSPNLLNPGAVGVYDGWERVGVQHRNQWLGANTQFMSSGLTADATFFKDMMRPKAHLGVGMQVYNDVGGASKFGMQTGSLTISGILPLGYASQISAGIQGGLGSRRGDASRLLYDSQWNSGTYDPTIPSGETASLNSFVYFDAGAGLFYQYDSNKSSFSRNNNVKFQIGGAIYHANAPQMKYRTGGTEQLNRKYVGMANLNMDIPNTKMGFEAQLAQFIQGGHYETMVGGFLRKRFKEGSKQTGYNRDASFSIGCYARVRDAIIPAMKVDFKGFQFGLSYDVTLSALHRAYKGGSLELSLSFVNQHHALFKTRRKGF